MHMRVIDHIPLIVDATGEYPLYLADVKQRHPNHDFPNVVYEDDIEPLGYYVVYSTTPPEGGVATEIAPVWVTDHYEQAWSLRAYTQAELDQNLAREKQELGNRLEDQSEAELKEGAPYTFPDQQTLHIRLTIPDRINILGLFTDAGRHITSSTPDPATPVMTYRTRERIIVQMTPLQMQDMCYHSIDVYKAYARKVMELEWAIDDATQLSELPTIPTDIMDVVIAEMNAP